MSASTARKNSMVFAKARKAPVSGAFRPVPDAARPHARQITGRGVNALS